MERTLLKAGDKAPDFTANDQNGEAVSLSDYKGKKVALYFYPKDNTPGCSAQACTIRDNFSALKEAGIVVLGVSADDVKSHKKFETKFQLPFTLIADTDKTIVHAYGVWGLKKFMGKEHLGIYRTTFLINKKGIIEYVIEKVVTKDHAKQILDLWK